MRFQYPQDIYIGSIDALGKTVSKLGKRVLIVRDSAFREDKDHGEIEDYLKQAGVESIFFDELRIGDSIGSLPAAIEMLRASHADTVIGVGGVITLSFARFLAFAGLEYSVGMNISTVSGRFKLPYIAIPSSDRNPFMFKDFVMLTGGGAEGLQFVSLPEVHLTGLFINPVFTASSSNKYRITSVLELLLNAIETYLMQGNPLFVSSMLFGVIDQLYSILDGAYHHPGGLENQVKISEAGFLVSLALGQSNLGRCSLFTYTLDGMVSSPRSIIASQLLPYVIEYGASRSPEKVKKIAALFGEDIHLQSLEQTAKGASNSIRRFISRFELPGRLRDLDIPEKAISAAVNQLENLGIDEAQRGVISMEDLVSILKVVY